MGPILHEQVCYTLYSTSGAVTQAYRPLLDTLSLTYPQFVTMMVLWQKDKISVTELAARIGLSKATMTPLLKRLELLGYLTREAVLGDERQKSVTLTTKGTALAPDGEDIAKQALCATGLTTEEAEQLMLLCQKVKSNL